MHLCNVSLLFLPKFSHTSDPRSVMPKPYLPQNRSQPTKTPAKHPIRATKTPFWALTLPEIPVIIADAGFSSGEMAEWLKALVLKTSDVERHRGFESLSLRQQNTFGMEKYPRGRRGSPAKGVGCDKRRPGSNPGFSARTLETLEFQGFSYAISLNPSLHAISLTLSLVTENSFSLLTLVLTLLLTSLLTK